MNKAVEPIKNKQLQEVSKEVLEALSEAMVEGATGYSDITMEDVATPFIYVLQGLSPICRDRSKNAREGMLYNSVTEEIMEPPVTLIPCAYRKSYVEWKPRSASGGGFAGEHDASILGVCKRTEKGLLLDNGNNIVETAYFYCLLGDDFQRVVVPFSSTALRVAKIWMSLILQRQATVNGSRISLPAYSHSYSATTRIESNAKGTWSQWAISTPAPIIDMAILRLAKAYHDDVKRGFVATKPESNDAIAEIPSQKKIDDDGLPF